VLPAASQWRKWFLTMQGESNLHVPQGIGSYYSKKIFEVITTILLTSTQVNMVRKLWIRMEYL